VRGSIPFFPDSVDEVIRHGGAPVGERRKSEEAFIAPTGFPGNLTGQGLAGEIREDFACGALLPACFLLDRQKYIVIQSDGGAHASDATHPRPHSPRLRNSVSESEPAGSARRASATRGRCRP